MTSPRAFDLGIINLIAPLIIAELYILRSRPGITCRFLGVPRVRYSDPVTRATASNTGSEYRTRGTRRSTS